MPLLWGSEVQVNTLVTGGTQRAPSAATLADGRTVIVWTDYGTSLATVKYKIYNADGSQDVAETVVNSAQSGLGVTDFPVVAALTGGGFAVAWDYNPSGSADGRDIYVATYAGTLTSGVATETSAPHLALANGVGSQYQAAIAGRAGGGFTLGWTEENTSVSGVTGNSAVMGRDFNAIGTATSAAYRLSDARGGDFSGAMASSISLDYFNTVWDENLGQTNESENEGIFGLEGGTSEGPVGNYTASGTTGGGDNPYSTPDVAYAANANFLAVWAYKPSPVGPTEIAGRFFNGSSFGAQFKINTTTLGSSFAATEGTGGENLLAVAGSGASNTFLVVWYDGANALGGNDHDVIGQLVDQNGALLGSEFVISTSAQNFITSLDVAGLRDGRFLVTWDGSNGSNVFNQVIDPRTSRAIWNGAAGNDQYVGTDVVVAANGSSFPTGDDLRSGAGDDSIWGGDGDDYLQAGSGTNVVHGGNGNDMLSFYDLLGSVTFTLAEGGTGSANFGALGSFTYSGIESIAGSDYGFAQGNNPALGADTLTGNSGDNWIQGFWGNDVLNGAGGGDALVGGEGGDTLIGGLGSDALTGGNGGDVFQFALADLEAGNSDYVMDYAPGTDAIRILSNVGGNSVTTLEGDAAVVFGNTAWIVLTGSAGQVIRLDFTNRWEYWDTGSNAPWSRYTDYLNAQGQISDQEIVNDNGTLTQRHVDLSPGGTAQPWIEYTDYYSATPHTLTDQEIRYDNGTIGQRHINQAGTLEYTDYVTPGGVLLDQEVINLNGTREQRHYDPTNTRSAQWSSYTDFFNAANPAQITARSMVYDGTNFQDQWHYSTPGSTAHGTLYHYNNLGVLIGTEMF